MERNANYLRSGGLFTHYNCMCIKNMISIFNVNVKCYPNYTMAMFYIHNNKIAPEKHQKRKKDC